MKMEVMFCSTMLVTIYKTTQYHNTEHVQIFTVMKTLTLVGQERLSHPAPLLSCFIGGEEFVCCHH
jgi:hypothetical protein